MRKSARTQVFLLSLLGGSGYWSACGTSGDLSLGSYPSISGFGGESTGGVSGTGAEGGNLDLGGSFAQAGDGNLPFPPCEAGGPLPPPERRFDFSGTGDEVVDLAGGPAGLIVGDAELDGSGVVVLNGDDYVDMPNGILQGSVSKSIMIWLRPDHGPAYWRIFDFGTTGEVEDSPEYTVGTFYLALTTETGFDPSGVAVLIGHGGPSSQDRALTSVVVGDTAVAATIVINGEEGRVQFYLSGQIVSETELTGSLSDIDDVNNWIGRSQYSADPYIQAEYTELRIYDRALSACETSALTALGPDNPG